MADTQLAPMAGVVADDQYDRLLADALGGIQSAEPCDILAPTPLDEGLGRGAVAWYIAYRTVES